jgi:hypothetical protein
MSIKFSENLKRKRVTALVLAFFMLLSVLFIPSGSGVLAAEGEKTSEEKTTEGGSGTDSEGDDTQDSIIKASTGRVSFWEWRRVTDKNYQTIFGDNLYHPVMFMMEGDGSHQFLNSYADKDHFFLPSKHDRINNFPNDFITAPGNPETTNDKYTGFYGREENSWPHSLSFYFDAEENLYISKGNIYSQSDADYNSDRFFTTFDDSHGVPWVKNLSWGTDNNFAISWCFPKNKLSSEEATVYQPDKDNNNEFYIYCGAYSSQNDNGRREPTLYISHDTTDNNYKQNHWNLRYFNNFWYIVCYNNSYREEVANNNFGKGILTGDSRYALFSYFPYKTNYQMVPQGSKSMGLTKAKYKFHMFVGIPHLMTSINSQTVKAPKIMPIDAGLFSSAETGKAAKSDGIILPKGNTLTIDSGTVYVDTNFINNGKIKIENGGTLIVKSGACISPYTKDCKGSGTIECDGGKIIVMEGGKIYGFCTGVDSGNNPYNENNAPLRMSGGSTLINYGTVCLTYGVVGGGSTIENRKNAKLMVGYNRKDQYAMMASEPNNMGLSDPKNYGSNVTLGLHGLNIKTDSGTKYDKAVVINEKTATFDHPTLSGGYETAPTSRVEVKVPEY